MAVAKYIGRDCELSTTGESAGGEHISSWEVTQAVLAEIDAAYTPLGFKTWKGAAWEDQGTSGRAGDGYRSACSSDCMRRWAPNGACFYADMAHVEVAGAACLRPRSYAAHCLGLLRVAEKARKRAEALAPPGTCYMLSTSNADMQDPSVSWGTHVNISVRTPLWEDLFEDPRHPATLGFVASAVAAAIAFFGSGYLLPLKDGTVVYSLSGRAHHLALLRSHTTTEAFGRGLLNSRREPHGSGQERLHLIGFDFNLISAALKASFLQCCLAAAEDGYCGMGLFDPVRALRAWCWNLDLRDGSLRGTAALVDGRELSLPAYMIDLTSALLRLVEAGQIPPAVAPEAAECLPLIVELAHRAARGEVKQCARHLDWAAKLLCLTDLCNREGLVLGDAETRLADHDFASTDPERGLLWRLWEHGLVDPLVSPEAVEASLRDGPEESRGWGRGRLIQRFYGEITDVDWGFVELRRSRILADCRDRWSERLRIEMPHLDSLNRPSFEAILEQASSLEELAALVEERDCAVTEAADPILEIRSQLAAGIEREGAERGSLETYTPQPSNPLERRST